MARHLPLRRAIIVLAGVAAFALPANGWAHGGPTWSAAQTTAPPTIDGSISASEWKDAPSYPITFGSTTATVRFEYTATALYVGVVVADLAPGTSPSISAFFDNNHDGLKNAGDDVWLDFAGSAGQDFFYNPAGAGGASHYNDLTGTGTNDTIAAGTATNGAVTFEIEHPLCSADTAHDLCVGTGNVAGVDFQYEPGTVVGGFFRAPGPDVFNPSNNWADLRLTTGDIVPPVVSVTQPAAGSTLSGTVAVAAAASDNVGVASVDFRYFDGAAFHDLGTDTTAPYTASFDTTTVANTVPLGGTIYAFARDTSGLTSSYGNGVTIANNAPPAPSGTLAGSVSSSTAGGLSADLTAQGSEDWAIWGYAGGGTSTSLTPDARKSGGTAISGLTNIDPAPSAPLRGLGQFAGPFAFSWSNGGAVPAASNVTAGIQHDGQQTNVSTVGKGFSFDVPADTTQRKLTVYVATNRASGQLTASLSDGSAPDYVDTLPVAADIRSGIYTIRYSAASAGRTLHVRWVETLDNCPSFRCDNAALYAVTLGNDVSGVTADLASGTSVGISGSSDPLAGIPLRAFEAPASGTTPAPINGLPINGLPINGLPINGLPINGLPINGLPINGLPINGLPINGLPINGLPINGLPINGLPLTTPGGWAAALQNTPLAGLPLQTITLKQVLDLPNPPSAIAHLTLGDLDLSKSALGQTTIGALALGATPINGLGLPADALASLQQWCASVVTSDASTNCTSTAIGSQSLFALGLAGAPINGLPINGLPINGLPINGLPINGLPINGLDLSASPINGLPINGLTLAGTPINGLPLSAILAAHAADGSASPFGAIKIHDLANQANVIAACVVPLDCATGTLANAATAGALKSTAVLADIGASALGSLTLGDLHTYGALTIGDLERSLVGTNATLGDLIGLLVRRADVPWESLSPRLLAAFDPSRPQLPLTAGFTIQGSGATAVIVKVKLPAGFDVARGTSTLAQGQSAPAVIADPLVDGDTLKWSVPSVTPGVPYVLHFSVYSGTEVGPAQATETVSAGGASSSSTAAFDVADSFEPNDDASAESVPVVTADAAVQQSAIARRGDVDFFRVPLPAAGTRLLVHLANLSTDYDLAIYANQTTSVRTGAAAGAPLADGTIADQSIDLQGGPNPQLAPTALQDVPNPGIPLVQVSANRGSDDEDVGMISPGGGGYATIAVFGYNGASSPSPYSLRVTTRAPATFTCTARAFAAGGQGTSGLVPAITSMPADLNTLVLVDEKRIGDTYGTSAETNVAGALAHLANDRSLGVSGAVVPVEGVAQAQYDAWDRNPCDVNAANGVANAIADEIAQVKAARPSLKYVVFAGGDDQIPFFRIADLSRIANESGFAGAFDHNEYYGSLASGDLFSDDPYLDTRPIPASGRQLFVPDLVGGRLVEKPAQIVSAVSRFESSHGMLARSSAFVSGYDFVSDGSALVQTRLGGLPGASPVRTLINNLWSKTDLLTAAFPSTGAAAINDWNGHYDNHQALAANGDRADLIATTDLTGPHAFSGGIFFTMGCHAGFQTTDAIVGAASPDALDWADYFAGTGTAFVGNTGFGLGNTDSVAFSEQLMADLAGNLNGTLSMGEALAHAKQDYYLARTAFSSYDEKTLAEAELYGLPMYGVGVAPAPLTSAASAATPLPSPDPVHGSTRSTSPSQGPLTGLPSTSAQVAGFSVTPDFGSIQTGAHGQYFTNAGQVQAPNYRPLQPFVTLPAGRPGLTAHGVLIDTLTSSDVTPFNPDNVRPTVDLSVNEPEPQFADEAWPTKIPALVSLDDTNGLRQSLNLTTGQFFNDGSSHSGVERQWTQVDGRVTYSSSTDFVPPSIDTIDAFVSAGAVSFSGRFTDLTETGAAGTVALAQVVYDVDNTGHWRALPLQRDPASGTWSAGASFSGDQVQYFVEACDMAGNCGYSSNKGRYFDAQPLPAATGAVTLTPSRTPDAGSWYTGALAVSAASTSNAHVSVSVDGGPFAPANSAITVSGDGVHVVDARASDGSEATRVFMIDSRAPAITRTVTPAAPGGANGWYTTAPTVAFSCADDVSGVAAGSCTVDGSALPVAQITLGESAAAQTVAATAADNAGNVAHDAAAGLKVDLTDPAAPTFTGVEAKTYAIANIPAQAAIGCVSSDAGSGLLRCVVTGYSPLLGAHTLTALATDNAGRTSTSHLTYVVGFQSGNALPPLAAPGGDQTSPTAGDLQLFKIKSTVPVKFRMYRDAAKSILMTTPPAGSVARLTFGKNGSSTPLITASASSDNLFRWTGAPDYQYLYNLQTAGVGAGTYYVTLTLFASDGVTALAQSAKQYFLLRS